MDYLYAGGLWVGAIRAGDTLVSLAHDGWQQAMEFLPKPFPEGLIEEYTTRSILRAPDASMCRDILFSETALSEHDLVAVSSDTIFPLDYGAFPDFADHIPLGLEIRQSLHAWSSGVASNFTFVHWSIRNVGTESLDQLYVGLFTDFDVGYVFGPLEATYDGDVVGTLSTYPSWLGDGFSDSVDVLWAMDADGNPTGSPAAFGQKSARGALGVRVLATPGGKQLASRNWWVSDAAVQRDWGPNLSTTRVTFPEGNLGTPTDDRAKYQMLANGEFDYDQFEAALNHTSDGWLPPSSQSSWVAAGADIRSLLSFGPYSLAMDSTLELWVALVGGARVHREATDYSQYWNAATPSTFTDRLDWSELARNAVWADWYYDNPGVDTDGDGYAGSFRLYQGDTIYFKGDGVPDFAGPAPPPGPKLAIVTGGGSVVIRWNGLDCERTRDRFSLRRDFEGYRVYLSTTGQPQDYAMLSQRDLANYIERRMVLPDTVWLATGEPLSASSLQSKYDSASLADYGIPFEPERFSVPDTGKAFKRVVPDAFDPVRLDTLYSYFPRVDMNSVVDDSGLASLDSQGLDVYGVIRKLHSEASPAETLYTADSSVTRPYYDYEYVIHDLNPVVPAWVAVTAFDHGDPELGAEPAESKLSVNATQVWPGSRSQLPGEGRAKPGIYPNPYSVLEDYAGQGWEASGGEPEQSRQITFYNLPDTCEITVWTLDGDLVIKIHHAGAGPSGDTSREVWNLLSRQETVLRMGLYIWAVESRFGNDVGKLAVIR